MKRFLSIVAVILALVAGKAIGGMLFGSTSDGSDLDRLMAQTASTINATLPIMVDSETELISTAGSSTRFTYAYRLPNMAAAGVDASIFNAGMRPGILNFVCTSPEMEVFITNGVAVRYHYSDARRRFITEVTIYPEDCMEGE
jgi:hypothetical protein